MSVIQNFDELYRLLRYHYGEKVNIRFHASLSEKAESASLNAFVYRHASSYCFFFLEKQVEVDFSFVDDETNVYCYAILNNDFEQVSEESYGEEIEACLKILKEEPKLRLLFITGLLSG